MTRTFIGIATAAFAAAAAVVGAQGEGTGQVLTTRDMAKVTVTGCVERVDALSTGPASPGGPHPADPATPGPAAAVTPGPVRPGVPGPAGTSASRPGTSAAMVPASMFKLSGAQVVAVAGAGAQQTSSKGSAASDAAAETKSTRAVTLLGASGVDLSAHVNHRVEVMGTIPAASVAQWLGASEGRGAVYDVSAAPVVTVMAVRMISTSCG